MKKVVLLICCTILITKVFSQEKILLTEKPGTFKTRYSIGNGHGADNYGKTTNYTIAEIEATKKNLDVLVSTFRQCPILKANKGFDGMADAVNGVTNTKFGYGLSTSFHFYFKSWSLRNGKEVQHLIEPPQFRFVVNEIEKFCSYGFNVSCYQESNPTNPAYSMDKMNKVTVALRELFFLPGVKNPVSQGIDRYGDNYVIFNPDRPPYWEQVTIRETYRLLMDYWKTVPDKIQVETMIPILESNFAQFSEKEKDGFAYMSGNDLIFRIGTTKNETPVMRPNPEYWNRNLPRSAIQFITLEIPDDATIKYKLEKCRKNADGYYYVYKLFSELDLNSLPPNIAK